MTLWAMSPTTERLAVYSRLDIDNIRVALDRAIAPGGDASAGAALAAAAAPLWIQMSCRSSTSAVRASNRRSVRSISSPKEGDGKGCSCRVALGVSLGHTNSPVSETAAVWTRVLELAESLGDPEYKSRALYGLWLYECITTGGYPAALAFARQFRSLAESTGDAAGAVTGDRIVGVALHFLGDQSDARAHIERTLDRYVPSSTGRTLSASAWISALTRSRIFRAYSGFRVFPIRPREQLRPPSPRPRLWITRIRYVLRWPMGPSRLRSRRANSPAAEQYVAVLIDLAEKHGLKLWHICGVGLRGWISVRKWAMLRRGRCCSSSRADGHRRGSGRRSLYMDGLGWLAEALGDTGHIAEAISAVNAALQQCDRNEERWCFPLELLRIRGELALRENGTRSCHCRERSPAGARLGRTDGNELCPGNCVPPQAWPGCGVNSRSNHRGA